MERTSLNTIQAEQIPSLKKEAMEQPEVYSWISDPVKIFNKFTKENPGILIATLLGVGVISAYCVSKRQRIDVELDITLDIIRENPKIKREKR